MGSWPAVVSMDFPLQGPVDLSLLPDSGGRSPPPLSMWTTCAVGGFLVDTLFGMSPLSGDNGGFTLRVEDGFVDVSSVAHSRCSVIECWLDDG